MDTIKITVTKFVPILSNMALNEFSMLATTAESNNLNSVSLLSVHTMSINGGPSLKRAMTW